MNLKLLNALVLSEEFSPDGGGLDAVGWYLQFILYTVVLFFIQLKFYFLFNG